MLCNVSIGSCVSLELGSRDHEKESVFREKFGKIPFLKLTAALLFFIRAVCLCVYLRLCHTVMAITRAYSFRQFNFFPDMVSLVNYFIKPTMPLIIGHFPTFANFHWILRTYHNYAEKSKFHGSARNSAAHLKLWVWALLMSLTLCRFTIKYLVLVWVNDCRQVNHFTI